MRSQKSLLVGLKLGETLHCLVLTGLRGTRAIPFNNDTRCAWRCTNPLWGSDRETCAPETWFLLTSKNMDPGKYLIPHH